MYTPQSPHIVNQKYYSTFRAGVACGRKYGVSSGCRLCSVRNSINRGWWPDLEIAAIEHVVSNCKTGPPCVLHLQNLDVNGVQGWEYRLVNAVNQGIVVIMNSGSSDYGQDACNFSPSFVPEIITVGAINETDGIASFGRTGPCVDFYAPGSNIRSSYYNSAYTTLNSTSAASSREFPDCPFFEYFK
jgi:subtilisin family serine protease